MFQITEGEADVQIVKIDFKTIKKYCKVSNLLEGIDLLFIKIDFSVDQMIDDYVEIIKIAKNREILTIVVVIGIVESNTENIRNLKEEAHSFFILKNDEEYRELISGVSGVVLGNGENDINLDFSDLKTVMSHEGLAFFGVGEDESENSALRALQEATSRALSEDYVLKEMKGIIVHFLIHANYDIMSIANVIEVIQTHVYDDSDVIFGISTDEALKPNYVKAKIVLTGYGLQKDRYKLLNNLEYKR